MSPRASSECVARGEVALEAEVTQLHTAGVLMQTLAGLMSAQRYVKDVYIGHVRNFIKYKQVIIVEFNYRCKKYFCTIKACVRFLCTVHPCTSTVLLLHAYS